MRENILQEISQDLLATKVLYRQEKVLADNINCVIHEANFL